MTNYLLRLFFTLISYLVPIEHNTYIFGSWFGKKFSDNSKYLYLYLNEYNIEIKAIWFTRDHHIYMRLKDNGLPVLYGYSFKSIFTHLRAAYVFYSVSVSDDVLGFSVNKKTKLVNMWHGTPIKKIGKDVLDTKVGLKNSLIDSNENKSKFRLAIKKMITNSILHRERYMISPNEEIAEIFSNTFSLPIENIFECGYPKLDHLINDKTTNRLGTILYSPTYRGEYNSTYDILNEYNFDVKKIDSWLYNNKLKLHIKMHPANQLPSTTIKEIERSENIQINTCEDVYEVLHNYEYLITDFSSLFFDALAVGVTSILAPFGYDQYIKNEREIYFSIAELFPFTLSYDWNQLINNFDEYKNIDQSSVKERFYPINHTNSSSNLINRLRSM